MFKWENFDEACDLMIDNYFSEKNLYDFELVFFNRVVLKMQKIFKFLISSTNSEIIELSTSTY